MSPTIWHELAEESSTWKSAASSKRAGSRTLQSPGRESSAKIEELEKAHARILVGEDERREALRNMLRELLPLPTQWNAIEEIWRLKMPPGGEIVGYASQAERQKLFADLPLSAKGSRLLVG